MQAQSTPLLSLNAEALAFVLQLATAEDDAKHTEAYGVRAPPRLALVCRAFRDVVLKPATRTRVLCVPLFRADGVTPTLTKADEWTAYFERFGDTAHSIRLLSSPAGPFDVAAHFAMAAIELDCPYPSAWSMHHCILGMAERHLAKISLVELPGTRAFGPTRSPSAEELGDAADTRTTRMELATRAPCALPAKRWLTLVHL